MIEIAYEWDYDTKRNRTVRYEVDGGKPNTVCGHCGVPMFDNTGRSYWGNVHCSDECRLLSRRAIARKSYANNHAVPVKDRACVQCGETFTAKRKDARYCSPRCRQRAFRAP
jgi:ribosomal protein S27AE